MATGTVAESREESKRDPERLEEDMVQAVSKYASALLSSSDPADGGTHPALLDDRLRRRVASAARQGLQTALESDASDCGARNAPACGSCGGRLRYVCREPSPVETALGRIAVPMGRYACRACGKTVRPREKALDIEVSMTPAARRLASLAGSSCCYEEADGLLAEIAG